MNAQTIAQALGESGCYFLSLLHIAGRDNDAIGLYKQAVATGVIGEDCFVQAPDRLLSLAAGGAWSVRHEAAGYVPAKDEIEILRFERAATTRTYAHFVVGDGRGHCAWDPLDTSQTVAGGVLASKRIIKRIA